MSEGKTTADNQKKRTSRTSSGTLHKAETPISHERSTRSTTEKKRTTKNQEKNSAQAELTEEDDVLDEGDRNETDEEVEKHNQTVDQAKSSRNNLPIEPKEKPPTPKNSLITPKLYITGILVLVFSFGYMFSNSNSNTSLCGEDWRSQIDPDGHLSTNQRIVILASLKPICDKSSMDQDEGVSTLLILSSNEEAAAKLARCLLRKVNKPTNTDQISTEIDLESHHGGKLTLDSKLRTLLNTTDTTRAVLLRRIGNIPSDDVLNQLRLLFAYCDGENPVIPHRLIMMTATSHSKNENELRENFKTHLPNEHDFIDALMSRISGHTLYLEKDQKSIC